MSDAATLTVNRDDLLVLPPGAQSYRFLTLALPVLEQMPEDAELRLQAVRHYTALGLVGPALEEAAGLPEELRGQLAAAGVFRQLEGMPSGQVEWSRFSARFEANLRVAVGRFPELERVGQDWARGGGNLELYRCRDGNYQVCTRDDHGRRVWLPRLIDHHGDAERAPIPGLDESLMPPPYLLQGVGLGWYLKKLVDGTRNRFLNYSPAIYVLEPNVLALAAAMHLHDWTGVLAEPRVFVLAGADCADRYVAMLVEQADLPMPRQHVTMLGWGPELSPRPVDRLPEIGRRRDQRCHELARELEEIYGQCDVGYWARRYERGLAAADSVEDGRQTGVDADDGTDADRRPMKDAANGRHGGQPLQSEEGPLRVCLMVSRHTTYLKYCIRDLASAFEARGVQTRILTERSDFTDIPATACLELVRSFRPDMFFVIDHFRREYEGVVPKNFPFVGWIQDQLPHLYDRESGTSLGPLDFFIAPDLATFVHQYDYPAGQGLAWTMATDDRVYSAEPLPESELAPYRCDFSYVSNQSMLPGKFHEQQRKHFASHSVALQWVDRLYVEMEEAFRGRPEAARLSVKWAIERLEAKEGPCPLSAENRERIVRHYLDPLAELLFRQKTLEWVADYCDRTGRSLHLYGQGWDAHPRFERYARGMAENGPQLRAIYQASAINLQIIGTGAVHQRLLDGLASGGFFLIRHTPVDMSHEAVSRHLAVLRRYRPALDTDLPAAEVPEVAETLRELHAIMGHTLRGEHIRLESVDQALYESLEADGYRRMAGAVFPDYAELSFASAEEFAERAERFLSDPPARERIAAAMRETVVKRYSYGAMVDALLGFVSRRLMETSCGSETAEGGQDARPPGTQDARPPGMQNARPPGMQDVRPPGTRDAHRPMGAVEGVAHAGS